MTKYKKGTDSTAIVTFANRKGGSAKTSTALQFAYYLSKDFNVLIIDLDPQANISSRIGAVVKNDAERSKHIREYNSAQIFNMEINQYNDKYTPEDLIIVAPNKFAPRIDIIPAHGMLEDCATNLSNVMGKETVLRRYILNNQDVFGYYDYIIIDTSPQSNAVTNNGLATATDILLPVFPRGDWLDGALELIAMWNRGSQMLNLENNIRGIIVTRVDERLIMDKQFLDLIQQPGIKDIIFKTIIKKTTTWEQAEGMQQPIYEYAPDSNVDHEFKHLMLELANEDIIEKGNSIKSYEAELKQYTKLKGAKNNG